jgi:hypothetical protein
LRIKIIISRQNRVSHICGKLVSQFGIVTDLEAFHLTTPGLYRDSGVSLNRTLTAFISPLSIIDWYDKTAVHIHRRKKPLMAEFFRDSGCQTLALAENASCGT